MSGMIILHDFFLALTLLTAAAETPASTTSAAATAGDGNPFAHFQPLPLQPSIKASFDKSRSWISHALSKLALAGASQMMLHEVKKFQPALPIAVDQLPLHSVPLPRNPSRGDFSSGTVANLEALKSACTTAGVTVHGGICAAIVVALAAFHGLDVARGTLRAKVEVDYNLRKRVTPSMGDDHVGYNVGVAGLDAFRKGIKLKTNFWDTARTLKKQTDKRGRGVHVQVPIDFCHEKMHTSQQVVDLLSHLPHGIFTDVNISNLGKYPFPLHCGTGGGAAGSAGHGNDYAIQLRDLHVYNNMPNLGMTAAVFVTCTDRLHYSFLHKMTDEDGAKLFRLFVRAIERAGTININESLGAAIARIVQD